MSTETPKLPLDLVQECLHHLPWTDLLTCQTANKDLHAIIRDSTDLQLRIHLCENGILASSLEGLEDQPLVRRNELQRLRDVKRRLSEVRYGLPYPGTKTIGISAESHEGMFLVSSADDSVFVPITEGDALVGVSRRSLDAPALQSSMEVRFGREARYFEVDQAEGVMLVVFIEDE